MSVTRDGLWTTLRAARTIARATLNAACFIFDKLSETTPVVNIYKILKAFEIISNCIPKITKQNPRV